MLRQASANAAKLSQRPLSCVYYRGPTNNWCIYFRMNYMKLELKLARVSEFGVCVIESPLVEKRISAWNRTKNWWRMDATGLAVPVFFF